MRSSAPVTGGVRDADCVLAVSSIPMLVDPTVAKRTTRRTSNNQHPKECTIIIEMSIHIFLMNLISMIQISP